MTNTKSSAQPLFDSVGFHITSALPLQTLRGIGMHHITSHDYHWDNRVRKNSYVLLQYTISGKGSFQTPDHTYPQQAGDLFLVQVPGDSQYSLPDDSECWDVLYLEFSSECLPLLYHIHQSCGPAFHLEASSTLPEQMKQLYADAISNQLASVFDNSKALRFSFRSGRLCIRKPGTFFTSCYTGQELSGFQLLQHGSEP